jgi:hypothetical protein
MIFVLSEYKVSPPLAEDCRVGFMRGVLCPHSTLAVAHSPEASEGWGGHLHFNNAHR